MKAIRNFFVFLFVILQFQTQFLYVSADAYVLERPILYENFENGYQLWTKRTGQSISADGGMLCLSSLGNTETVAVYNASIQADDFKITAKMMSDANFMGIIFCDKDQKNNFLVQLGTRDISLYERNNSTTYVKYVSAEISTERKFYNITVTVCDGNFTAAIDGVTVLTYDNCTFTGGNIGFRSYNGNVYIDSVSMVQLIDDTTPYYNEITDGTTKEIFRKRVSELPKEIPVKDTVSPYNTTLVYYVSLNGNDNNNGSIESPFLTLERAISECSKKDSKTEKAVIYLREGNYNVGLELSVNVSGVYISAYPGEDVCFTTGFEINPDDFFEPDEIMKSRLSPSSMSRVYCCNLSDYGIIPTSVSGGKNIVTVGNSSLHLSRWPNYENVNTGWIIDKGPVVSFGETDDGRGFRFKYYDERIENWQNISDVWMYGGFSREWAKQNIRIREINAEENEIHTYNASYYGARSGMAYYYYNVFEELDMPDEYYIDYNENKLYMFKPQDKVFFSSSNIDNVMNIPPDTRDVVISDINFKNIGCGGVLIDGKNNVLQKCTFENISGVPANVQGMDNHVINSEFFNCRGNIMISGGDRKDLVPAGNTITNCSILNSKGILLCGVGNIVSHNYIADSLEGGITINSANECIVEYNELTNIIKDSDDSGAIYCGGDITKRGMHIRYNYIHDIGDKENGKTPFAIYFDDVNSDNFAYGNIIVNVEVPVHINGGREIAVVNNIMVSYEAVDTPAINIHSLVVSDGLNFEGLNYWEVDGPQKIYTYYDDYNFDESYWFKRYPKYQNYFDDEPRLPKYNYLANNLCVNYSKLNYISQAIETLIQENNVFTNEDPGFENMSARNFSIPDTSDITKQIPDFDAPDFDKIGTMESVCTKTAKLYMPYYGESMIDPSKVNFSWENSYGKSDYKLIISENNDMSNPIAEIETSSNHAEVQLEHYNTDYYWTVVARNYSKSTAEKEVGYPIFKFKTMSISKKNIFDIYSLTKLSDKFMKIGYTNDELKDLNDQIAVVENLWENGNFYECNEKISELTEYVKTIIKDTTLLNISFSDANVGTDALTGLSSGDNSIGSVDGERVLVMTDESSDSYTVAQFDFEQKNEIIYFSTRVRLNCTNGEFIIKYRLADGSDPIVVRFSSNGTVLGRKYVADTWYNIETYIYPASGEYEIYVNDSCFIKDCVDINGAFKSVVFVTGYTDNPVGIYYVSGVDVSVRDYNDFQLFLKKNSSYERDKFVYLDVGKDPEETAWHYPLITGKNGKIYNLTDSCVPGTVLQTYNDAVSLENINISPSEYFATDQKGRMMIWDSIYSIKPIAAVNHFPVEE